MNPVLVATALSVVAVSFKAVSARDARVALGGLAIGLVGAAFLVDPLPAPLPALARVLAAVLATELLWIAARETSHDTHGSAAGPVTEALAALTAFVAGTAVSGVTVGAGLALAVASVTPLVLGRESLRLGIGVALAATGAIVLRAGLVGAPTPLEQLVTAGVVAGLGAAAATLVADGRPAPEPAAERWPTDPTGRSVRGRLPVGPERRRMPAAPDRQPAGPERRPPPPLDRPVR